MKKFVNEKSKLDPINSGKIMSVCKGLNDYPIYGSIGIFLSTLFVIPFNIHSSAASGQEQNHWVRLINIISVLCTILCSLRGFLIFLIFVSNQKIIEILKKGVKTYLPKLIVINLLQINALADSDVDETMDTQ